MMTMKMKTIDRESLDAVRGGVTRDKDGRSCTEPRPTTGRPWERPRPELPPPYNPEGGWPNWLRPLDRARGVVGQGQTAGNSW
jgi:hypothetical protein